ncbi:MAG: MurR/RpiR family transcriptional regulator [Clostridia bacterium]
MDFEKRVYEKEFKLNDTDDSIIEYIRENRENISKVSIQKIATDLFISPNAIMRLARKIGYSGFSELKYALQSENSPSDYKTVASRIFDKIPQNVARTLDVSDEAVSSDMVKLMDNANRILFVGVGDSVYFCEMFGRYLRCLDKKVEYFHQIHDSEYIAQQYTEGDLIVVISASGKTERLVTLARKAQKRGVKTVCMTHYGANPLSKVCDMQVCFWGEKRIVNNYNVTDYIGLMMCIRSICEQFWKEFSN